MIDKIGKLSKIFQPQQKEEVKKPASKKSEGTDSINISAEAKKAAETAALVQAVNQSTDPARLEKIEQVKQRLAAGEYDDLSPEMLDKMADRIAPTLLQ